MSHCAICDRDAFDVWSRARAQLKWDRQQPLPCGGGRGWLVSFLPWRNLPIRLFAEFASAMPRCRLLTSGYRLFTCGEQVCIFRATHHGVPGANYEKRQ